MISASPLVPAGLAGWGKGSGDMVGWVFIESPLPFLVQRLMARLARYAAGLPGSNTLPSKKRSCPRLSPFGICAAGTLARAAALRQISERLTWPITAILLSVFGSLPQRCSSVRNHRSWLLYGKDAFAAQNFILNGAFLNTRPSPMVK